MAEKQPFAEYLAQGVVVFDGAMGTEIYRHHVFTNRCFDELNLSDPKLIRKIHQSYCEAGAEVLTTNTFGANRETLAKYGLAEQVRAINQAGAQIARQVADAADRPVYVAGSIGPLPTLPQNEEVLWQMIWEQVDALVEGGVDFIIFETQPSRQALELCAAAMRERPGVPFILSAAVYEDGETASGETVQRLFAPLPEGYPEPLAWGLNCGSGPHGLLGAVEQAVRILRKPLVVQPNAGIPKEVEHRRIYLCSPEYLAEYAKRFVNLGAAGVGGCCGTTPEHIRAICDAVKPLVRARVKPIFVGPAEAVELKTPVPLAERSRFAWRLVHKQWVTSVELVPPRGYDLRDIIEKSKMLHRHGVDAVNIPDGPRASSRISPLITADRIQREAMIEVILHFCCRDRNLIGMQADLLACAACDIRNILFITGDPPKLGNYPHATGVFDTDSIGMVGVQKRLNQGVDLGGQPIDPPTAAVIGVGLDPTAIDQNRELDRFRRKVEAGAEFAITQPVFDPDALLRFLDKVQHHGIPIIAGIWPLASLRNATFLKNEVPGVVIPDWVMEKMASVTSREDQLKMGIEIARQAIERIRDRVAGVQVSAPFGKIQVALEVIGA
ncbi:MAG: bifunctional homocysteine S-methyltransferase/methylenetetrahydrofolate reductase [Thermogutta sp.]|uniref:bifunctional homocysteine S-methyltransferase/methylenetetrahydrofolate reductase n=1 Tax=Thermogutta sp. TaxID=1962930 RepID=UPI0019A9D777|nr:bifunctional homocysteine S-methyltransferase/methylenetetrahydrofolate reductase [Thermogutta sp.]MBC7352234.1 bifunctional homocysteine S-methyltransferase/methylenetetrahydrofolate reductase [Thermogutta sp.]